MMTHQDIADLKHAVDFSAVGSTILCLLDLIPHFTAALVFIWMSIRIYETDTVQKLLGKKIHKKDDDELPPKLY